MRQKGSWKEIETDQSREQVMSKRAKLTRRLNLSISFATMGKARNLRARRNSGKEPCYKEK